MEHATVRRFTLSLALGLSGCGGDSNDAATGPGGGIVCTANLVPALSISVLDDATGMGTACGATAVVTEGPFSETVQTPAFPACDDFVLGAALERTGTYSVVVSKAGYQNFTASNIVVTANPCHVNTVTVTARMVR
jgi:hypothetical protein